MKKTRKLSLLAVFFILSLNIGFAQKDSIHFRIPHQISVEFGYRYSFYQHTYLGTDGNYTTDAALMNRATSGVGILADYGWQLGGLDGKKPALYLTIPMGYTFLLPDDPTSKRIGMLNYGWTIRHDLATKDKKIIPFVGYGLF